MFYIFAGNITIDTDAQSPSYCRRCWCFLPRLSQQALIYLMPVITNKEPQIKKIAAREKDNFCPLIVGFMGQHQLFLLKK